MAKVDEKMPDSFLVTKDVEAVRWMVSSEEITAREIYGCMRPSALRICRESARHTAMTV